jgi:hypothetical protein
LIEGVFIDFKDLKREGSNELLLVAVSRSRELIRGVSVIMQTFLIVNCYFLKFQSPWVSFVSSNDFNSFWIGWGKYSNAPGYIYPNSFDIHHHLDFCTKGGSKWATLRLAGETVFDKIIDSH